MTALKRRLKQQVRSVDFPAMLQALDAAGYSDADVAEIIGTKEIVIKRIRRDSASEGEGWQAAMKLADMYLRVTHDTTLPFI